MDNLKCEIMSVGNEILFGDIVDTNSQFITQSLSEIGVEVLRHTSVRDNFCEIVESIDNAFSRGVNLLITSGGLGPTDDDITKEASAKYFGKELILNSDWVLCLEKILKVKREEMTKANLKQAYIPEGSEFIKNDFGTAPGIILNFHGKIVINLPGPPMELYPMFNNYVKPYIENLINTKYYSEFLRVYGISEGNINHHLTDLFSGKNPTLAPYIKDNDLVLRITAKCQNLSEGERLVRELKNEVYKRVGNFIYAEGEKEIEELLFEELHKRNFKISFAESCTGGMVSSKFVNFPGASSCFCESFVTYSNESKIKILGVKSETLDKFGAVSEETALEMANGLKDRTDSQVCISVTGVAGPSQSESKPAGLVYICVKVLDKNYVEKCNFSGDRKRVREKSAFRALMNAYNILKNF